MDSEYYSRTSTVKMKSSLDKFWFLLIGVILPMMLTNAKRLCKGREELILAQVIYRHGNRTLSDTYKTDPFNKPKYWPDGFGVLTSAGKKTERELGKYFRRRYASLLGCDCSTDKVYTRSNDENRTIASVQYTLAGLFPSCPRVSCNECKNKGEITIYTVPQNEDYLLNQVLPCASADKLIDEYLHSNEIQELLQKYSGLREYLETNSGSPAQTVFDLYVFHDALNIEYTRGLPLPKWALNVLHTQNNVLEYFAVVNFASMTHSTELKKLKAGFLLKVIFDRFKSKTLCRLKSDRLLWMYSTHDYTLINILNSLGVFKNQDPPYGASIHFELYRIDCEYFVQIFYRDDNSEYLAPLRIPKCGTKCPLSKLYKIYKDILPAANETHTSLCRL